MADTPSNAPLTYQKETQEQKEERRRQELIDFIKKNRCAPTQNAAFGFITRRRFVPKYLQGVLNSMIEDGSIIKEVRKGTNRTIAGRMSYEVVYVRLPSKRERRLANPVDHESGSHSVR